MQRLKITSKPRKCNNTKQKKRSSTFLNIKYEPKDFKLMYTDELVKNFS